MLLMLQVVKIQIKIMIRVPRKPFVINEFMHFLFATKNNNIT